MTKRLSEFTTGKILRVVNVLGGNNFRSRLIELGFVKDAIIKIENISPMRHSFLISCQNSLIALKLNAVNMIEVKEIIVNKRYI